MNNINDNCDNTVDGNIDTSQDLYFGINRLDLPIEPDKDIIKEKYPEYLIYLNYNKLDIHNPYSEIINTEYPKFIKQPIIVTSPTTIITTTVSLDKNVKELDNLLVIVEAHYNAKMFYLKLYMDANTQQQFYRYVNKEHKKELGINQDECKLTEEEYNKAAKLVHLPHVLLSQYSRLKYLPDQNPMRTSMTDAPTLIKYSNLLIDDLIASKGINSRSKYNTE